VHIVGFIIRFYRDARSPERQILLYKCLAIKINLLQNCLKNLLLFVLQQIPNKHANSFHKTAEFANSNTM